MSSQCLLRRRGGEVKEILLRTLVRRHRTHWFRFIYMASVLPRPSLPPDRIETPAPDTTSSSAESRALPLPAVSDVYVAQTWVITRLCQSAINVPGRRQPEQTRRNTCNSPAHRNASVDDAAKHVPLRIKIGEINKQTLWRPCIPPGESGVASGESGREQKKHKMKQSTHVFDCHVARGSRDAPRRLENEITERGDVESRLG